MPETETEFDSIAWALKALRDENRQGGYRTAYAYYDGDHPLLFATEKFKSVFGKNLKGLKDNLCPAVVDSLSDRLKVTGFQVGEGGTQELAEEAWAIWRRNRMDVRSSEVHHESLLTGDGYALVWPNKAGEALIWPLPACNVAVAYDPNQPGVLRRAVRIWQDDDDGRVHIDVYWPDRVERFVTKARKKQLISPSMNASEFLPYFGGIPSPGSDLEQTNELENRFGQVPIVHFPNRRYHAYGISELATVIPLQDSLNKTLCDRHVTQEFAAFRQRWATGVITEEPGEGEKPTPPWADYGVDRMITSADPNSKFGSFEASDVTQYIEAAENDRAELARVSGTPLHYLFITKGDFPSGEAMKSAEARFTRKVENRQSAFGNQWEDLFALALRMEGTEAKGEQLSTQWESASPTAGSAGEPVAGEGEPDDGRARGAAQPQGPPIGGDE